MGKAVIKGIVLGITFFIALFVISKIMNKGNNDLTVEMPDAEFPVVYMGMDDILYNELHGYAQEMDTAYMRDTITALNEGRSTQFQIAAYGQTIEKISYEIRSVDGQRLIENTQLTEYTQDTDTLSGKITVKDLIEENTEYAMILMLQTEKGQIIRYYTRIVWAPQFHLPEKLAFALDFHEKSFDKEAVKELAKYMETNSEGDNSTLHRVDIHCSLNQVAWGNLPVKREQEPVFNVTELAEQTASIVGSYIVSTGDDDGEKTYFYVEEYYRLRYTPDRIYLLDYVRSMNTLLNEQSSIYVNDKIMLGVAAEDLPLFESGDGNVFAFVLQNRLYSYNVTTNKMAVVFGFYDKDHADSRTLYNQHDIKVLDIDEGGNIHFAVYGYMNRGRHEGEVGVQIYYYNSSLNTIEEELYIPYDGTYRILRAEMEQLLYLNREEYLYLLLHGSVYEINLLERSGALILEVSQDGSMRVSDSNKMMVWQSGSSLYESEKLILMDLGSRDRVEVNAGEPNYILPLGFMGEDLIYGLARKEDVVEDSSGGILFPMYGVYIRNASGEILKTYRQEGVYIQSCSLQNNQITLERLLRDENGIYTATTQDYIMNNAAEGVSKNKINVAITERYGKYVQIEVSQTIDGKTIQVLTPKEVLYEGGKELLIEKESATERYYVYGPDGTTAIYRNPARAVSLADAWSGVVLDKEGGYVWMRGNRAIRNQIMAIEAASVTEEKGSLAVCLDTMLLYEGIVKNSEYLLSTGETAYSILEKNLENARILELEGCSLDSVLYYVNQDIPVLACLKDGNAVLVVGFNEYNVLFMDPQTGTIERIGKNDSSQWLEENGNFFITYIRK
ncbi:MAG: hypothetical protein J1E65_07870 [Lachnospiraceae bacterium]|nr:hypothetical protein [Lachnospiraceae bacterium]